MTKKLLIKPILVFDLGGVLLDWNPHYLYCDKLGLDPVEVDQFLQEVGFSAWNKEQDRGRPFTAATAELSAQFPHYHDLIHAYDQHYADSIRGVIQPVVDILKIVKNKGFSLYVLSNWSAEKFREVRPQYEFFEWFDGMIISGEVGLIKPEKAIFDVLLERIGHPAEDCLFIDDHLPNIQAASDLGFQTHHFQSAMQFHAALLGLGILAS
jgi:2-haloacid dehalogenase